jgi:hypothetical protein
MLSGLPTFSSATKSAGYRYRTGLKALGIKESSLYESKCKKNPEEKPALPADTQQKK